MNKKLMILGASELQVPAIECANKLGVKTIVLDYDANAIGKSYASKFYNISTLNYKKILEIAKNEKIDGIMTICSDRPMPIVAKIGDELGLNTISYETALNTTKKDLMRKSLLKKNVPIPQYFICKNFSEFRQAINKINGKKIIKPSNNSGSRGVCMLTDDVDLENIYEYSKKYSSDEIVLVEEFMEGPEASVEVFINNGEVNIIQITDKITTGAPYFVEIGHTQPSSLNQSIKEEIKRVTELSLKALGVNLGPAHVEVKVTSRGVKIIEVGARLGGDHITTDLVPLSTGIDMVTLAVKSALGLKIEIKKIFSKASAIRYVRKPIEFSNCINEKNVIFNIKNTEVKEIKSSNDRAGYYITYEENLNKLLKKIKNIDNLIKEEIT